MTFHELMRVTRNLNLCCRQQRKRSGGHIDPGINQTAGGLSLLGDTMSGRSSVCSGLRVTV